MILGYESYDHNFISIMNNNPEEVGTLGPDAAVNLSFSFLFLDEAYFLPA